MAGTLFVVATPIGNLDDISPRAIRVLREVALIAAEDTRHTAHLLQRFGVTTPTTSLHEHNERGKGDALIERLRAGESIALVSDAGTPTVSDPGQHLVERAHATGLRVESIPGASALIAALSASGMRSDSFVFMGFPPSKGTERHRWFEQVHAAAAIVPTLVFYEAPHRILRTLSDLLSLGDAPIMVARELTKAHEDVRVGRLSALLGSDPALPERGEYTVVVDLSEIGRARSPEETLNATVAATEFSYLTKTSGLTRRQAITQLSRKYRVRAATVFDLLEEAKTSGR